MTALGRFWHLQRHPTKAVWRHSFTSTTPGLRPVRTVPFARVCRTPGISCEAVPASMPLTGAGMRRHVHPRNHAAESFVSFIPLFCGPTVDHASYRDLEPAASELITRYGALNHTRPVSLPRDSVTTSLVPGAWIRWLVNLASLPSARRTTWWYAAGDSSSCGVPDSIRRIVTSTWRVGMLRSCRSIRIGSSANPRSVATPISSQFMTDRGGSGFDCQSGGLGLYSLGSEVVGDSAPAVSFPTVTPPWSAEHRG